MSTTKILPSNDVSSHCPNCECQTQFKLLTVLKPNNNGRGCQIESKNRAYSFLVCSSCHRGALLEKLRGSNSITDFYPKTACTITLCNKPSHAGIREEWDEALRAYSGGAYRACAIVARSCLEKIFTANGYYDIKQRKQDGAEYDAMKLQKKIEKAEEERLLSMQLKHSAHLVRWTGNDIAHDEYAVMSATDVDPFLQYVAEMFSNFYLHRAEVEKQLSQVNRTFTPIDLDR